MRSLLLILSCFFLLTSTMVAQNINLLSFVRPRVSLFANNALPYQLEDSVRFSESQAGIGTTIPLRTRLSLKGGLKKAKGSVWLANFNARYRTATTEVARDLNPFLSLSGGVTGVRFSLEKGVWVYSFGGGLIEEVDGFGAGSAFGYGAVTRLKIKGLRKLNAYGAALVAGKRFLLPIPIVGWYRNYKKKRTLTVLLPISIRYTKGIDKGFTLRSELNLSGFTGGFSPTPNPLYSQPPTSDRIRLQHSHLRLTGGAGYKFGGQWLLGLDAGFNFPTSLQVRDGRERLYQAYGLGAIYLSASLRYRFKMKGLNGVLESLGLF